MVLDENGSYLRTAKCRVSSISAGEKGMRGARAKTACQNESEQGRRNFSAGTESVEERLEGCMPCLCR